MAPPDSRLMHLILCGIIFSALTLGPATVNGSDGIDSEVLGVAIQGYDPVAYFTEGKPMRGTPEHAFKWNEATWYFVSNKHRDMFAASPEKYAPNHGGF